MPAAGVRVTCGAWEVAMFWLGLLAACGGEDPCDAVVSRGEAEALFGRPLADAEAFRYDGRGSCSVRYGEGGQAIDVRVSWIWDDPADALREERWLYDDQYGPPEVRPGHAVQTLIYRSEPDPAAEAAAQACFARLRGAVADLGAQLDADPGAAPDPPGMPTMDACLRLIPPKGTVVLAERTGDVVTARLPDDERVLEAVLANLPPQERSLGWNFDLGLEAPRLRPRR